MTDTVLLWVLVVVLVVAVLAVAVVLRLRNRPDAPVAEPGEATPVHGVSPFEPAVGVAPDEPTPPAGHAIPVQRSSGMDVPRSAPTPPSGMVPVAPVDPVDPATDPALAALDPHVPTRGVGALAAEVLVGSLRREGPFVGSVLPSGDGTSASDPAYRIKASTTTRRFYRPESPHYAHTRAQLWFRTATDAERAGFTAG